MDKLFADLFVDRKVIDIVLLLDGLRLQFFHHLLGHIHARDEVTATDKRMLGGTYLYMIEVDDNSPLGQAYRYVFGRGSGNKDPFGECTFSKCRGGC